MDGRLFIRVPQDMYDELAAAGAETGAEPSGVAREMIANGAKGPVGKLKLVSGPFRRELNIWLPAETLELIAARAARDSQRFGVKIDRGSIARSLIRRGLDKREPRPTPMQQTA